MDGHTGVKSQILDLVNKLEFIIVTILSNKNSKQVVAVETRKWKRHPESYTWQLKTCEILPGTRGGNPVFIGETSIGSFMGGRAFGSPVGCLGGLFSSKLESEPLL